MNNRRSGVLLHITSLPSPWGIGDLGPEARKFADFLFEARQCLWQVLPLNPTLEIYGSSPYSSPSAFAGNPLLISPEDLVRDGVLDASDLGNLPFRGNHRVDYPRVAETKDRLLRTAFHRHKDHLAQDAVFQEFCRRNSHWLEDYATFMAVKRDYDYAPWGDWPQEIRDRQETALAGKKLDLHPAVLEHKYAQYLFFRQWFALKDYCNRRCIQIIGDMPIYVSHDSADVWANPRFFKLDEGRKPRYVAGVPPDYFSETGQLWGNPVYCWDEMEKTEFRWWVDRLEHNLILFDILRLDHFRGFVAYWEVPGTEKTAIGGRWVKVPTRKLFDQFSRRFASLPIIAEDLGVITAEVREVMRTYGFPGMKILLFAFGGDVADNPYAPHSHTRDSVVYTGTHDNNTVKGWFREEAGPGEKEALFSYLGRVVGEEEVADELVRLGMMSVARMSVFPMQDLLALDERARMNLPAVTHGNWEWRMDPRWLSPDLVQRLSTMTRLYGRC